MLLLLLEEKRLGHYGRRRKRGLDPRLVSLPSSLKDAATKLLATTTIATFSFLLLRKLVSFILLLLLGLPNLSFLLQKLLNVHHGSLKLQLGSSFGESTEEKNKVRGDALEKNGGELGGTWEQIITGATSAGEATSYGMKVVVQHMIEECGIKDFFADPG